MSGDALYFKEGITVRAAVLDSHDEITPSLNPQHDIEHTTTYLLYAQNRLFTAHRRYAIEQNYIESPAGDLVDIEETTVEVTPLTFGHMVCDYCIIPRADEELY